MEILKKINFCILKIINCNLQTLSDFEICKLWVLGTATFKTITEGLGQISEKFWLKGLSSTFAPLNYGLWWHKPTWINYFFIHLAEMNHATLEAIVPRNFDLVFPSIISGPSEDVLQFLNINKITYSKFLNTNFKQPPAQDISQLQLLLNMVCNYVRKMYQFFAKFWIFDQLLIIFWEKKIGKIPYQIVRKCWAKYTNFVKILNKIWKFLGNF